MNISEENVRIIFGLKVRQLRMEKGYSLSELAEKSDLSISYLNEIEKGKKYPKANKIMSLSEALGTSYDKLVSLKLTKNLAPVGELMQSRVLEELPLNAFGIEPSKLIEIIANAPAKVNAFISTLIEISRKYHMKQEDFYHAALRSYQESHDNYFEDLEKMATDFSLHHGLSKKPLVSVAKLQKILEDVYDYKVISTDFKDYPELREMRSVTIPGESPCLMNNTKLSDSQLAFNMAREIGYQLLDVTERSYSSSWFRATSFDQLLNNMKASYIAGAILINRDFLKKDIEKLFGMSKWDPNKFRTALGKYTTSPEMFFIRLSNILPRVFNLKELFYLRFSNMHNTNIYNLTKELHISQPHNPHGNEIEEHYCRRWVSIGVLKEIEKQRKNKTYEQSVIGIQRSSYLDSDHQYLVLSIARPLVDEVDMNRSVTIGILINKEVKKMIGFWEDPNIEVKTVNETCERCRIADCKERAAEPYKVKAEDKYKGVQAALKKLTENAF